MCISRNRGLLGLVLVLEIAGCAQDRMTRTGPRSIASIGDKTEVVVSGEPGASIASSVPDYPGDRLRDSKISGRVVDDHGRAVANAKVRLAIAGAKGGRVESVKADSSGAFTLRRLKPGSSYVVIAEAVDGGETLVGRVEAKAPQSNLKVALYPRSESAERFRTSSNSGRAKFGPASNIDDQDDEDFESDRPKARINREDFDPPAPEAESLESRPRDSSEIEFRDNTERDIPNDGEESKPSESPRSRRAKKLQIPASLHPDRSSGTRALPEMEDDGENPLPPAIEGDRSEDTADAGPGGPRNPSMVFAPAAVPEEPSSGEPSPMIRDDSGPSSQIQSNSVPSRRGGLKDFEVAMASATESSEAGGKGTGGGGINRPSQRNGIVPVMPDLPAASSVSLFEGRSSLHPDSANPPRNLESRPPDPSDGEDLHRSPAETKNDPPISSKTAKWGDIVQNQVVPLDESLRKRLAAAGSEHPRDAKAAAEGPKSEQSGRFLRRFESQKKATTAPNCRYDSANRRLHDFQLPDVHGKLVSFKDFDSDLILLDFWGTWCAPCKTSIPQLIEFRQRYGRERLQIIGIACERVPAKTRADVVSRAQKDLGIDYPVVITGKDEPCALQEALQVQFYPTMILLDREGHILWREQGATETTLTRLERAIRTALHQK